MPEETLQETFARGNEILKQDPAGIGSSEIPVSSMETATKPADLPVQEIDAGSTLDAVQGQVEKVDALDAENTKRADDVTAQSAAMTASTASLRDSMSSLQNKSADRARLENESGIDDLRRDKNEITLQMRQGIADLRSFDLQTIDDRELARQNAGGRDITRGVFGAKDREFSLQRSIQRSHKASDLESLAATSSYLSGDIEIAQTQADRALAAIYDPIEQAIENEKFFYSGIRQDLSAAKKAAGDSRMAMIEREESSIGAAKVLANNAVASGVATPEEVRQLTNPNLSPDQRTALASQILARGSNEERALANEVKNAQIRSSNRANQEKEDEFDPKRQLDLIKLAGMGDPKSIAALGYDPRELGSPEKLAKFEQDMSANALFLEAAQGLVDNDKGLQASSGDVQSPLLSGFATGAGGAVGLVPIVGRVVGAAETRHAKQNFLAEAGYLLNNQTFDKLVSLKADGATFGALSDSEREAIGRAATKLGAAAVYDPPGSGIVSGFNLPEETVRQYVGELVKGYEAAGDQLLIDALGNAVLTEAEAVWNE